MYITENDMIISTKGTQRKVGGNNMLELLKKFEEAEAESNRLDVLLEADPENTKCLKKA